jgi:hypothetical protein
LPFTWVSHDFNVDFYLVLYLAFNIGGQNYRLHYCGGSNGANGHGCIHDWGTKKE